MATLESFGKYSDSTPFRPVRAPQFRKRSRAKGVPTGSVLDPHWFYLAYLRARGVTFPGIAEEVGESYAIRVSAVAVLKWFHSRVHNVGFAERCEALMAEIHERGTVDEVHRLATIMSWVWQSRYTGFYGVCWGLHSRAFPYGNQRLRRLWPGVSECGASASRVGVTPPVLESALDTWPTIFQRVAGQKLDLVFRAALKHREGLIDDFTYREAVWNWQRFRPDEMKDYHGRNRHAREWPCERALNRLVPYLPPFQRLRRGM